MFAIFGQSLEVGLASAGQMISYSFLMIVMAMLLIVAIDVPFQLWQYHDRLKMTKEDTSISNNEKISDTQSFASSVPPSK